MNFPKDLFSASRVFPIGFLFILLTFLFSSALTEARDSPKIENLFSGNWGLASGEVGIKFQEPGVFSLTPFMGPGGFAVSKNDEIWISDSITSSLKLFGKGKAKAVSVKAKGLGDLAVFNGKLFVCTQSPRGIQVIEENSGKHLEHISIPFTTPGKLLVADEQHLAVEEVGEGIWIYNQRQVKKHPSGALEAVGNFKTLYGTVFDFVASRRKIISSPWNGEKEPELFALYSASETSISYSRLLGMRKGLPVFSVLTASEPEKLRLVEFDVSGKIANEFLVPVPSGCYLPSSYIVGSDDVYYGMKSDLKGFSILRILPPLN